MRHLLKTVSFICIPLILTSSCGTSRNVEPEAHETQTTNTIAQPTTVDSASYKMGIEHAVDEKLLKKYKIKKENKK